MNLKRFTARTSSEALAQVREALGDDAVVLSTKPVPGGVEVLALAPEGMQQIEAAAAQMPAAQAPAPAPEPSGSPVMGRLRSLADRIAARGERLEPTLDMPALPALAAQALPQQAARPVARSRPADAPDSQHGPVDQDVKALGMSTLTFQDYVRERMLRRRQTELERQGQTDAPAPQPRAAAGHASATASGQMYAPAASQTAAPTFAHSAAHAAHDAGAVPQRSAAFYDDEPAAPPPLRVVGGGAAQAGAARTLEPQARRAMLREPPVLREELPLNDGPRSGPMRRPAQHDLPALRREAKATLREGEAAAGARRAAAGPEHDEMLGELRSVRSLIEERFGMLAFMDKLQRNPKQVALSQQLFDIGLSPGMVRKLVQALPETVTDGLAWAATVLENNLVTNEGEAALEDHEGVFALIGPTGVGKTTSTAKIAAAFAAKHGAANLGLITLDAYRVGAHEQLRTYGRILGVPVHTAHDRSSLEDLLELLAAKRMVLIDTAGMAQRDARTRELLEMLSSPAIHKLLVVNAAAQGETVEDVMVGYRAHTCDGVIVSKLDEAVKLGPALDALIRHTAKVVGVANGQRVPEDWHRLSAQALVQRAMHGGGTASWRFNAGEVNLMFAATQGGSGSSLLAPQGADGRLPA